MRLVTCVRRSPARARFRHAWTVSQEWTPTESPWTLPTGLFAEVHSFGRPSSRRTSWFAASEIASPIASALMPSASAAATASAACPAVDAKIVSANFSTQASSAVFVPGFVPSSLCWSSSFGSSRGAAGCYFAWFAFPSAFTQ